MSETRSILAVVQYDGTEYCGFQRQVNGPSVQACLEVAITKVFGKCTGITGASRTDAGAHALGQVIQFRIECPIPVDRIPLAINTALPRDISVVKATEVEQEFHARFAARSRVYYYVVLNRPVRNALLERYSYRVGHRLNAVAMNEAAHELVGKHDFKCFASNVERYHSTVRQVMSARVRKKGDWVYLRIEANGFLQGMIRAIMGTLIQVGIGKQNPTQIKELLRSGCRDDAGDCVPAKGLCLYRVNYPGNRGVAI
ncbi:MAG: tRNA pseudouridine(38-40) synthase TruA [Armatimonadota bacterium]